jgi:hypothetical protein
MRVYHFIGSKIGLEDIANRRLKIARIDELARLIHQTTEKCRFIAVYQTYIRLCPVAFFATGHLSITKKIRHLPAQSLLW